MRFTRQQTLILAGAVVVILIASISAYGPARNYFQGLGQNNSSQKPQDPNINNQAAEEQEEYQEPASSTQTVRIENGQLDPQEMTIGVDQDVYWHNEDEQTQVIVSDNQAFSDQSVTSKDTIEYRFTKAGTFSYHLQSNPDVKGKITVTE